MDSFWSTEAYLYREEDDFYCFNCLGDEASLDIFIDKETLDSSYALIIGDEYAIGDKDNHVSEDVILTKGNELLESVIGEYATLTKDQLMEMTYNASTQVTSEYNDLGTDTRTGLPWGQTEDMNESTEPEKLDERLEIDDNFRVMWGGHLTNIADTLYAIYKGGDNFNRQEFQDGMVRSRSLNNAMMYLNIFSALQRKGWLTKERQGRHFKYHLTPEGMKQVDRVLAALGEKRNDIKTAKPETKPESKPETKPVSNKISVMPFEQCFFASMVLDAEDYSGPRECSWISPSNLREVLETYTDEDDNPLNVNELKRLYEEYKAKILNGESKSNAKLHKVGYDYGEISSRCIPDITEYGKSWPEYDRRQARVQLETTLWMLVTTSRDDWKFNDNEWDSCPVKKK